MAAHGKRNTGPIRARTEEMKLILVLDDVRSAHNVGALFRTADAVGIEKMLLCGITPYPKLANDTRLPHLAERATNQIAKTALGAENTVLFEYCAEILPALMRLKDAGYKLYALEQAPNSKSLFSAGPAEKAAIIVGHERVGLQDELLRACDQILHIPMVGKKESLNVTVAGSLALYWLAYKGGGLS
jgi:23S rRNA (guanosine2251-2'-O)-methyltransferase